MYIKFLAMLLAVSFACQTDFVDFSRTLCSNSPKCYSNFYLDQPSRFADLLDYALEEIGLEQEQICNCTNPDLYLALLENYHFCHDNEIFTPAYDCICRHDRTCNEKKPSEFTLGNVFIILLLLAILAMTTYFSLKLLSRLVQKHFEEQQLKKTGKRVAVE
jgi:hypothetical protein